LAKTRKDGKAEGKHLKGPTRKRKKASERKSEYGIK